MVIFFLPEIVGEGRRMVDSDSDDGAPVRGGGRRVVPRRRWNSNFLYGLLALVVVGMLGTAILRRTFLLGNDNLYYAIMAGFGIAAAIGFWNYIKEKGVSAFGHGTRVVYGYYD